MSETKKRVISVVADQGPTRPHDDGFETPEITYVGVSKDSSSIIVNADDFARPASDTKTLDGVDPVFKRAVTNNIKKFESGKIEKVRRGSGGAESTQIVDKEFLTGYDAFDVVEPPYNLDYLARVYVSPSAAPHYAAVNAKVANIVGLGYKLVENARTKRELEKITDEDALKAKRAELNEHREEILEDIENLNEEDTFTEVLTKVWRDYETTGNGYIEVGRKKDGTIGYFGHVPVQTLRIRRKRDGFVQVSGFKAVFFGNYGDGVDRETGVKKRIPNPIGGGKPNEILHISKYSPSSGQYGVPDIVPALNAVTGNELAARFNLDYFENKAVPRHVIILKGAKLGNTAEKSLLSFFQTDLKGQHHRSLYIPLPGDTPDNKVELKIEAIEAGVQDASFANYRKANLSDILMAHRVPITKISVSDGASLSIAKDADKTFKEQVCAPEQKILEKKLNRIIKEMTNALDFKLNEMTLTDENTQSQIDERRRKTGVETANEQRVRRGDPTIEGGDELFDMNAAQKIAEMSDETTRRGQDKSEAQAKAAAAAKPAAGANANGNPVGTRQRDTTRSANRTDSAGAARNPKGDGRTTS